MARVDETPSPKRKRKEIDVTPCDASRCRASHRCGLKWTNHARRRQRVAAKDDSGTAGRSAKIDSVESRRRGLHRQLGNRRVGQRVHGGEESERGLEVAALDKESQRPSSDHQAL